MPETRIIIRVSQEHGAELRALWREIRIASGYGADVDLPEPEEVARFDGAALAEWIPAFADTAKTLLPAILGYLIAKRGEVEIDGRKFKNISVEDIDKIFALARKHGSKKQAPKRATPKTKNKATKKMKKKMKL